VALITTPCQTACATTLNQQDTDYQDPREAEQRSNTERPGLSVSTTDKSSPEDTQPARGGLHQRDRRSVSPSRPDGDQVQTSRVASTTAGKGQVSRSVPPPQRPGYVPAPLASAENPSVSEGPRTTQSGFQWRRAAMSSCFTIVVIGVLLFFLATGSALVGYVAVASQLPSPQELQSRGVAFVSSKILDRNGNLLYEVTDPEGGRRTYVDLDRIAPDLINAVVATEDREFWVHPGFDPIAIVRALYYNLSERRIVSGFSTITQQVARNVLLTPEERVQDTAWRKIKEVVLATELTRTYPKETILETYLNESYYGNLAYGVEAAAETYFGEAASAQNLTLAQAAFLAGLPQLPATYDPFGGGRDQALSRQRTVLSLMVEAGYISDAEANAATAEMEAYEFKAPHHVDLGVAPHFVVYARQQLEAEYGPEALYRGTGLRIYTTLDTDLQAHAEQAVREGLANLVERNATNASLVAVEPATGQILAMVGSANFTDETIDGQVNVALRCRQPGSSIKPLTYLAAFERGWTPATLFWDVKTEFPDGANPPYVPVNYDREYHGPMLMRDALANSYNVPAVDALQFVGVNGLLDMAERLGVMSLAHPEVSCPDYPYDQPPTYGLALTLGGGEAKLLEMTGAFGVLANAGVRIPPSPILRIEDSRGRVLVDDSGGEGVQVISLEHAYLMTHVLSDAKARCVEFRCPSLLELDRPAAAKTGTTDDYRDALTIGYTPDIAAGVWVGNSDNSPMVGLAGSAAAGPIWHNFMVKAHQGLPVRDFDRPAGVLQQEVCADSGALPNEYTRRRKLEVFAKDQPPLDASNGWYQMVKIDAVGGLVANEFCPDHVVEELRSVIRDPRGRAWAEQHPERFGGTPLVPLEACSSATDRPQVVITSPGEGSTVQGLVSVRGTVRLPAFDRYEVQYGIGDDPQGWGWISGPHRAQVEDGFLSEWATEGLVPGQYTLRVSAFNRDQHRIEARVEVQVASLIDAPAPVAAESPTPTDEYGPLTETPQPTGTSTLVPAVTPSPTVEPTQQGLTRTVEPPLTPDAGQIVGTRPEVTVTATLRSDAAGGEGVPTQTP
jgi:membrane peptidoglycan carboxypeptidase